MFWQPHKSRERAAGSDEGSGRKKLTRKRLAGSEKEAVLRKVAVESLTRSSGDGWQALPLSFVGDLSSEDFLGGRSSGAPWVVSNPVPSSYSRICSSSLTRLGSVLFFSSLRISYAFQYFSCIF